MTDVGIFKNIQVVVKAPSRAEADQFVEGISEEKLLQLYFEQNKKFVKSVTVVHGMTHDFQVKSQQDFYR